MTEWATLLRDYGPWALVLLVILSNLKQIGAGLERILARFFPSYQERVQHRRELEQLQLEQSISERMDTIIVFKELMLEYRKRLDDLEIETRRERAEHEQRILEIVRGYERSQTQVVEAMREISEVIRSQTDRLDRLTLEWGTKGG